MPQRRRDCSLGASTRRSDGRAARNRFGETWLCPAKRLGCAVYDTEAKAFGLLVSLAASSGVRKRPEQLQAAPETRTAHMETSERAFPGLPFCPNYLAAKPLKADTSTPPPDRPIAQLARATCSKHCNKQAPQRSVHRRAAAALITKPSKNAFHQGVLPAPARGGQGPLAP